MSHGPHFQKSHKKKVLVAIKQMLDFYHQFVLCSHTFFHILMPEHRASVYSSAIGDDEVSHSEGGGVKPPPHITHFQVPRGGRKNEMKLILLHNTQIFRFLLPVFADYWSLVD